MSKSKFLFCVKALILLSPLPFGCDARIWSPLFFLALLVVSGMALFDIRERVPILYEKKIRLAAGLYFGYIGFQLIPLPRFILNILSPATVETLDQFAMEPVSFHPLSLVPADTLIFGLEMMALLLFFWVMAHQDLGKREIYSLVRVVALSAFIQLVLGGVKWFFRMDRHFLFFYETGNTSRIMNGTFWRADHLAFYLQMVLPLVLGLVLVKFFISRSLEDMSLEWWNVLIKKKDVIFYGLVGMGAAGGIILTKSPNGRMILFLTVLYLAAGFVFFRVKMMAMSRTTLRWLVLALVAFSFLYVLQNGFSLAGRPDRQGDVRSEIWGDGLKVVGQFPIFGTGYGNFKNISYQGRTLKDGTHPEHVTNSFLEQLVEGGVLGFGLFFTLMGLVLTSLVRMWLARHHPEVQVMGLAMIISVILAGVHDLFDYALHIPANGFLFALVLALGFRMVLYKRTRPT